MEKYRKGNIELRPVSFIHRKATPKEWDIVKWYRNEYYYNKDKYEPVPDEPWHYRKKKITEEWETHCYIGKSCFDNPESCYSIGSFDWSKDDEEPNFVSVGSRFIELPPEDLVDCLDVIREFYKQWRKWYEESGDSEY